MHVALSDLLTCPRCGPTHGLILLPDEVRERRVRTGVLGCANCRERYPVVDGVADLRVGGAWSESSGGIGPGAGAPEPDPEEAVRMAALLGLGEGGGTVLMAGPGAVHAPALAGMLPELSVVAIDHGAGPAAGVSSLRVGGALPLRSGALRGVALTGERATLMKEGARLLGPTGRLVLEPAPEAASDWAQDAGLQVLLEQDRVLVAGRGR